MIQILIKPLYFEGFIFVKIFMNLMKPPIARYLLCFMFFGIAFVAHAQDKPSFIGMRSGVSIPFGKYAEKNLDDGCFAQAGFNVTVEGAWFFKPKFGVGASVSLDLHPVDVASLAKARVDEDPFLNNVVVRSEPYLIITAMVGPYFQLPVSSRFSVSAKLLGGLLYGKTPYQLYKPDYYLLPNNWAEITSAKDWKFSWQTGVGMRYNLSSCIDLIIDTDLYYDQFLFSFSTNQGVRTDKKTISFINATVGFRVNF